MNNSYLESSVVFINIRKLWDQKSWEMLSYSIIPGQALYMVLGCSQPKPTYGSARTPCFSYLVLFPTLALALPCLPLPVCSRKRVLTPSYLGFLEVSPLAPYCTQHIADDGQLVGLTSSQDCGILDASCQHQFYNFSAWHSASHGIITQQIFAEQMFLCCHN